MRERGRHRTQVHQCLLLPRIQRGEAQTHTCGLPLARSLPTPLISLPHINTHTDKHTNTQSELPLRLFGFSLLRVHYVSKTDFFAHIYKYTQNIIQHCFSNISYNYIKQPICSLPCLNQWFTQKFKFCPVLLLFSKTKKLHSIMLK